MRDITAAIEATNQSGIGGSAACDGQILVTDDKCWACSTWTPKFVRRYADLRGEIGRCAVASYAEDVRERRRFPGAAETYFHHQGGGIVGKGRVAAALFGGYRFPALAIPRRRRGAPLRGRYFRRGR